MKTWGRSLADYYRRVDERMEEAAKHDLERLREMEWEIEEGVIEVIPSRKRYAVPGTFPMRYWDVRQVEKKHRCLQCRRVIKPAYKYCYQCHMARKTA